MQSTNKYRKEKLGSEESISQRKISDVLTAPQVQKGCREVFCRIDCSDNEDLYRDTAAVMNSSECGVITSLLLSNQVQHSIDNLWINSNKTVLKLVLMNSQISKVTTGAFSAGMFSKLFHMTWVNLQVSELSNGALLGLYSLRKLEIDFKIPNISLTFLQPVQVTLTHLRINAGISFNGNLDVFENIYLGKLNHLDLSHNSFSGPLSKRIFSGTPNITYLYLMYCSITSIEDNAFQDIADTLILIDLKHNLLTRISENVLHLAGKRILFNLEPNNWNCDCQLRSMIDYYTDNKSLFISTPYCRMPYSLYGKLFDELDPDELSCEAEMPVEVPINPTTDTSYRITTVRSNDVSEISSEESTEAPTNQSPYGAILQFSCSEAIDYDNTNNKVERDVNDDQTKYMNSGTFVFEPPIYDLILDLFDNYSVRAYIDGYQKSDQYNIIWFSDHNSDSGAIRNASQTDYTCMQYEEPYLIVDPLRQNHTYTFCMMPLDSLVISPLLCQPLYVPIAKSGTDLDDVWIAEDEKQFTIAMLCLIFFISTVFGAIFAYLGLKSFPNLLEGSKNVLVVKEVDKECYVSTIADSKYIKTPLNEKSFRMRNKKSFDTSAKIYDTNLPSLVNLRSPSTCFEEPFTNVEFQTIGYEMPKQFKKDISDGCNISKCRDRPNSPPPLPKRNSSVSEYMDPKLKA
ncbi:hypothetical protein ACLKA6_007643 [Drosophila palustris]